MTPRTICALLTGIWLATVPGTTRAQSDDSMNKLSLEALTAPQPGDGQHHGYHAARRVYGGAVHHRGYVHLAHYHPYGGHWTGRHAYARHSPWGRTPHAGKIYGFRHATSGFHASR